METTMLARLWTSPVLILSVLVFLTSFGCASQEVVDSASSEVSSSGGAKDATLTRKNPNALDEQKSWSYAVGTEADFMSMSKKSGDQRFLKMLIDLKTGHAYYFDVNIYPFHADFAFRQIYEEAATPERRKLFAKNYEAEKPEFILLTIANHESSDIWTYHLWEGDEATPDHIRTAHERIQKTFYNSPRIRFLATSPAHEKLSAELTSVPSITSDSIYKLAQEHTFNIGRRVGVLRIVRPDEDPMALSLKPHHIVILQEPVPHLTAVAGIISEKFSTPLAHVNLRAAAWGIPHIGLRGAAQKYHPLDAKPVFFEATAEGHGSVGPTALTRSQRSVGPIDRERARKTSQSKRSAGATQEGPGRSWWVTFCRKCQRAALPATMTMTSTGTRASLRCVAAAVEKGEQRIFSRQPCEPSCCAEHALPLGTQPCLKVTTAIVPQNGARRVPE